MAAFFPIVFALAALAAEPTASPPPSALVGWTALPLGKESAGEYASFSRREPDGSESRLSGTRQLCDCQPGDAAQMLHEIFSAIPGAVAKRDKIDLCGHTAERFSVTGLAAPKNERRNMEVILYRSEPALYMLTYSFRVSAPMPDAERALSALCKT